MHRHLPLSLLKTIARPALQGLGAALLAVPPARRRLNAWHDRASPRARALTVRCFLRSPRLRPFAWRVSFPVGAMDVPVRDEFPQSWGMALGILTAEPALFPFYDAFIAVHRGPRVFFDVGANHGIHAYRFMAAGYRCVLFEPQETCLRFVREVLRVNGWEAEIERGALSDTRGEREFFVSPRTWYSSFSRAHVEGYEPADRTVVHCDTLDEATARRGIPPGLIKIDVEGHELEVIHGGRQTIEATRPPLVVEMLWGAASRAPLFDFLRTRGYRMRAITSAGLVPIDAVEALLGTRHEDFLFCADAGLLTRLDEALRRTALA